MDLKEIKDMTDAELKKEYESMHQTINVIGCYGTKDLLWYYALEKEIGKRGGDISESVDVQFSREDDD
jgi:hypothetical protein